MIIAERKPILDIWNMIKNYEKILIVGCGTCVTVCQAGGEKEVGILASALRMLAKKEGKRLSTQALTIKRQCDDEFVNELKEKIRDVDAILSMACGAGVQMIAEKFNDKIVLPTLNTAFIGTTDAQGVWSTKCAGCGDCILDRTEGICPIARCSKSLLNGPCGGTTVDGKCEVNADIPCAWYLIYTRMKDRNNLSRLDKIQPPKDWRPSGHGGARKIIRDDLVIERAGHDKAVKK